MGTSKYYPTKQDAENHKLKKGERVYYEAGNGWYIVKHKLLY